VVTPRGTKYQGWVFAHFLGCTEQLYSCQTDIGEVVDWIRGKFSETKEGYKNLAVLHNRTKMEKRRKVEVESSPDPYSIPGDARQANPGWMFLKFDATLSVGRSELVFKLSHHRPGLK